MHTGQIVFGVVVAIILLIVTILSFVFYSKIDKTRYSKLKNGVMGASIAALLVFVIAIVMFIVVAVKSKSEINYGSWSLGLGIIFGVVILVVGIIDIWATYSIVTAPLYTPTNEADKSALVFGLASGGLAIAAAAMLMVVGIFVGFMMYGGETYVVATPSTTYTVTTPSVDVDGGTVRVVPRNVTLPAPLPAPLPTGTRVARRPLPPPGDLPLPPVM